MIEIYAALSMDWPLLRSILQDSTVAGLPDAEKKLALYFASSSLVFIGKVDGKPICAYGLMSQCFTSNSAYMWLLHTKALDDHKFIFVRHSQKVIERAFKTFDEIHGHVELGNESGQRWLKWLGAKFSHSCLEGDKAMPFVIRKSHGRPSYAWNH